MWNNKEGEFVRYSSDFRQWVKKDGSTPFTPENERYHLYISWACPWAHRTAIVRNILGLEEAISISAVDPVWNENGWTFTESPAPHADRSRQGVIPDTINHKRDLIEIYHLANPKYENEETTPVLWDKKHQTIVNNESPEIIKMFSTEFTDLAKNKIDLYPESQRKEIDEIMTSIYPKINNGVYRTGFATSQAAYERAYSELFKALDFWEQELSTRRYMSGKTLSLADICMFTTLLRFDLVYYSHFKCNQRHIHEYPNLWGFVRDIYQTGKISETCNFDHIKRHYYISQKAINPTQIVPLGPAIDFSAPHSRAKLS